MQISSPEEKRMKSIRRVAWNVIGFVDPTDDPPEYDEEDEEKEEEEEAVPA